MSKWNSVQSDHKAVLAFDESIDPPPNYDPPTQQLGESQTYYVDDAQQVPTNTELMPNYPTRKEMILATVAGFFASAFSIIAIVVSFDVPPRHRASYTLGLAIGMPVMGAVMLALGLAYFTMQPQINNNHQPVFQGLTGSGVGMIVLGLVMAWVYHGLKKKEKAEKAGKNIYVYQEQPVSHPGSKNMTLPTLTGFFASAFSIVAVIASFYVPKRHRPSFTLGLAFGMPVIGAIMLSLGIAYFTAQPQINNSYLPVSQGLTVSGVIMIAMGLAMAKLYTSLKKRESVGKQIVA